MPLLLIFCAHVLWLQMSNPKLKLTSYYPLFSVFYLVATTPCLTCCLIAPSVSIVTANLIFDPPTKVCRILYHSLHFYSYFLCRITFYIYIILIFCDPVSHPHYLNAGDRHFAAVSNGYTFAIVQRLKVPPSLNFQAPHTLQNLIS